MFLEALYTKGMNFILFHFIDLQTRIAYIGKNFILFHFIDMQTRKNYYLNIQPDFFFYFIDV